MKVKQVTLQSGSSQMTTWLESRADIKPGNSVELKETGDKLWDIIHVYQYEIDASDLDFHRKWDNNNYDKHDGLKIK